MLRLGLGIAIILAAGPALAAPEWAIVPAESTLGFTATQNGAPTEGGLGTFSGTIVFDPDDLAGAKIEIDVDMTSVAGPYDALSETLKQDDWFASAAFPKAHYSASIVSREPAGGYRADGTLTLRGISAPVALTFDFKQFGPKAGASGTLCAVAEGDATVMRTVFGVGQGAWAKTDEVKDAVRVHFTVTAERSGP